jgi:hypothetical protein
MYKHKTHVSSIFQDFAEANLEMTVFWDVALCRLIHVHGRYSVLTSSIIGIRQNPRRHLNTFKHSSNYLSIAVLKICNAVFLFVVFCLILSVNSDYLL